MTQLTAGATATEYRQARATGPGSAVDDSRTAGDGNASSALGRQKDLVRVPAFAREPTLLRSRAADAQGRAQRWLSARHSFAVEAMVLIVVYASYNGSRGMAVGGRATAVGHARTIWALEHGLHLSVERELQRAAEHVPGLVDVFGVGYATFHLGVTGLALLWLYRRRPTVFVRVRTALVLTSGLALIGFALYPTAPPRLAGVGISDTLSLARATSESGLLRFAYNPYAAMPSIHVAYAIVVGGGLVLATRHRWLRLAGVIYPGFVVVEVIATGNHFVLDALGGAVAAGAAAVITSRLTPVLRSERGGHGVAAKSLSIPGHLHRPVTVLHSTPAAKHTSELSESTVRTGT